MRRLCCRAGWCVTALLLFATGSRPQPIPAESLDQSVTRLLDRSKVMEHLFYLTDVTGPRVVGSPALDAARRWLEGRLRDYGLGQVRHEENPPMAVGPGV